MDLINDKCLIYFILLCTYKKLDQCIFLHFFNFTFLLSVFSQLQNRWLEVTSFRLYILELINTEPESVKPHKRENWYHQGRRWIPCDYSDLTS